MVYTENEPVHLISANGLPGIRIEYAIREIVPDDKKDDKKVLSIYDSKIKTPPSGYTFAYAGFGRSLDGTEFHGWIMYEEIA